jgi:hypothetical protein
LEAVQGGKVTIAVKSDFFDWEMESSGINGFLEVGPGFPIEPGERASPGEVQAVVRAWVTVQSLKSRKGGKPFSEAFDRYAYEKMKAAENPKVFCELSRFVLKEAAASGSLPYKYEAHGHIAIAGVTNVASISLDVLPLGHGQLRISGQKTLRMTDFGIGLSLPGIVDPPTAKLHNEINVAFEWLVIKGRQL